MSYSWKGCKIVEANTNRIKGYINTLRDNIYGPKVPSSKVYKKDIGYDSRDTILEDGIEAKSDWKEFENGAHWGGKDVHACFRTVFTVPQNLAGKEIWMQLRTGVTDIWNTDNPQFLIYINKEIICGMDMNHHEVCIAKDAKPNETFEIGVYAYSNSDTASDYFELRFMEKFPCVEKLYYDAKVMMDLCLKLRPDDLNRIKMLSLLSETINRTDLRIVPSKEFYESTVLAARFLCDEFYSKLDGSSDVTVHSIGHTHIDVAWKWPVRQTREKALRSFSTVLNYMEDYPEYRFIASTPQLYQFVKEQSPEIYGKIKNRVKEGRWETEGAMWLEADCNLTSGESLVRQILFGKRFFEEEFGTGDNKVLWLPDVFGYSAALPQILKKSEIDYFMTTKINWNESDKMPHDVLFWKGIDGSEVLTYFITTTDYQVYPELNPNARFETTYNGRQNVNQVMGTWQRFQDKDLSADVLTCYGFGDGGGGPTREMLEEDKRMAKGLPGMPVTKQTFTKEFFDLLSEELEGKKVPKWNGELYLEYHRGTYTSQAANKKNNRLAEYRNEDAEWLSVLAHTVDEGFGYPVCDLEKAWKITLLNQFHDILPGSSIAEVYRVTDAEYAEVFAIDEKLAKAAMEKISGNEGENIILYNPCAFERDAYVETSEGPALVERIPSKGYKVVKSSDLKPASVNEFEFNEHTRTLQTPFYQVVFNEAGEVVSLYDKRALRELVKEGEALNRLIAFEDRPWEYDCWNIDEYYCEKNWVIDDLKAFCVVENNSERFSIKIVRGFLNSEIRQVVSFYRASERIDFKTNAEWKEQQILLKAAFPVEVLTNKCTCDIQFGNVERPTHRNTSWDEARFEFAAQKWVDVSEADYGVALLNDCKYGYDVFESTMRITLIKSGIFPDPNADKGHHEFSYALLPHLGDFRKGNVIKEGYKLNRPVLKENTKLSEGTTFSLVSCDKENVFVDTVKKAEKGDGIIIRLHEEFGARSTVKIDVSGLKAKTAISCNLLEKEIEDEFTAFEDGIITTTIKPYEILTFKLY